MTFPSPGDLLLSGGVINAVSRVRLYVGPCTAGEGHRVLTCVSGMWKVWVYTRTEIERMVADGTWVNLS